MSKQWYRHNSGIRVVTAKDKGLHIANGDDRTYCGKIAKPVENVTVESLLAGKERNGHSYGQELIKSATCKTCKEKAQRDIRDFMYYWPQNHRREFFADIFQPFKAPRPFPKRDRIGGVNKLMSNVRERCRRKSNEALSFGRVWIVRRTNTGLDSTLETWDSKAHAAFMVGVNYAIDQIFDEFKLEKYDKFKDKAYAEMHEIITGEKLPDDRNEE